jgi:hypothetical protein
VGTPPFKPVALLSVYRHFPKLINFVYTNSQKLSKKIAETFTGQGSEAHNERIRISVILPELRFFVRYF